MKTLVELSPELHQQLYVVPHSGAKNAAKQNLVNLRVTEVAKAACSMAIFFVRDNQTGQQVLTGFTSFEQGNNLFVTDSQWQGSYPPTSLQTFPFYLMQSPDNPQQYTIGIDADDSALSAESGQAIFEQDGSASLYLSNIKNLIEADMHNDMLTQRFSQKISELGLMKYITIVVNHQDGLPQNLTGLITINEEKLQQLDSETLAELNKLGYLSPLYAMLMSLYQLNSLIQLHNKTLAGNKISNIKLEVSKS
ncbi:SapC family protein [Shewanella sp. UCD-KL21]|uniref:SapC family protein n=1 Tax=Shewanella sp. UCD-KL21 TaxID=1917164 RepID=UPI000970D11A|nr:SapC family protein [Shewanella sp. UCD-KL21]